MPPDRGGYEHVLNPQMTNRSPEKLSLKLLFSLMFGMNRLPLAGGKVIIALETFIKRAESDGRI